MKRLITATMLVGLLAVACGKDAKPLVDAAEAYEKATCACEDAACLTKSAEDYAAATKKLQGEKLQASEDQAKKIASATEKAVACTTKLTTKMATDAAGSVPAGLPGQ